MKDPDRIVRSGTPRQNGPPGVDSCSTARDAADGREDESVLSTLKGLFWEKVYLQQREKRQRCGFQRLFILVTFLIVKQNIQQKGTQRWFSY